jgi:hypothetical protein
MREYVETFACAMEEKLKTKDDERGEDGWMHDCTVKFLFDKCILEQRKMKDSIDECNPDSLMEECVDLANFSMMIYSRLLRKKISG